MKRYITLIIIAIAGISSRMAMATENQWFPYPVVPEGITVLDERCNYLVFHFWDKCPIKTAFSSKARMNAAFGDWVAFMPYAAADTVHMSISRLIDNVKKSPKNTLELANIAESWLYSDTAQYVSEEIYLPFAKAVATNKKIASVDRARFEAQVRRIESSGLGVKVPALEFTTPEGHKTNIGAITAPNVVLFFNDPDCDDCRMATVRLSADINAGKLIKDGKLQIVSLYPGDPDDKWLAATANYPAEWIVGAMPDADLDFDLSITPAFYFLDSEHKVIAKNIPVDNILRAFIVLNTSN